ncbi:zinc finger CCCH domain-containing protein 12-like [Impatiens glandulifera]|uniref:zinc finger CCCH domain-containing protein 12-like n=1 Tax=Impatiens glandulifera TaxID=253017 RepID=UPI001FB10C77|nr:zinc finger CCCH domain-containing protein 12-like [Impatiens glandulifera]
MPGNRQVRSNGCVSNPPLGELEDAVRRLKVDQQNGSLVSYPDRPGEPDCIHYLRTGQCGYRSNCRFNHPSSVGQGGTYGGEFPERVGQPDCVHYLKTGTCKYGSSCKYHHPADRNGAGQVVYNTLGLPLRQEEKSCSFYMRTGQCKFGAACKFHHPEPSSVGTFLPVYGTPGSSVVQFSGPPYASGPPLQGFQNYGSVIVPSQNMVSSNGWNTYLGCPVPALGSDLSYYKNVVESGSSSIPPLSTTVNSYLPERPDKPECRNYLSTGNCKYGSGCKYHHPRDRSPQWAAYTLGPLGLPMRPGQAVCSHYSLYGLCKYGPSCKFDHPLAGYYSYNYSLNHPTLSSTVDPSFGPQYQMNAMSSLTTKYSSNKLITNLSQKKPDEVSDESPIAETPPLEEDSSEINGLSTTTSLELDVHQDDNTV